ncbi:MAG TPA: glycosyltransferase family 4 protein [Verrucomicrobiae bacterium]|nr:glycosyltransferase family 4 protein [Verrucomicrobiae bacterium]
MKNRLKIGVITTNLIRIPPRPEDLPAGFSGAPEQIASVIMDGLVEKGHDVTLFASGDSKTRAKLVPTSKISLAKDPNVGFSQERRQYFPYELLGIVKAYQTATAKKFDLLHSHLDFPTAYFSGFFKFPTVTTLHSPFFGTRLDIMKNFQRSQYYVSISNAQRKPLPGANFAATIYHGVDTKKFKFNPTPKNQAVIVGRIHKQKGISEAIEFAKKLNFKLIILGSHQEDEYWQKKVKPNVDGRQIVYKNFLPQSEVIKIVSESKFFLFPLQWEEPFGLVLIEAMATGTPVVAYDRGSVAEIVKQGKTGFVANTPSQIIFGIKNIEKISRVDCRRHVEQYFSYQKMIDNYESLFLKLAKKTPR